MAASTIYGLLDPRTSQIRYIGQSVAPHLRLRHHVKPAALRDGSYRSRWIAALRRDGLRPDSVVLDTVDVALANDAEQFWIAYFRSIGAKLTNYGDGGQAGRRPGGWHHSEATKAKIRAARALQPNPRLGTKHSAETIQRFRLARAGRVLTPEHRANIAAAMLGTKRGPYKKRAQ